MTAETAATLLERQAKTLRTLSRSAVVPKLRDVAERLERVAENLRAGLAER